MSLADEQRKYERWWLHKRVSRPFHNHFRLVTGVRVIGPPSGFNAIVELTYDGGKTDLIGPPPHGGYKPRKFDLEIEKPQVAPTEAEQGGRA